MEMQNSCIKCRSLLFVALVVLLFSACTDNGSQAENDNDTSELSSGSKKTSSSDSKEAIPPSGVSYGKLFDERDGRTYKTVKIGNQEWMAENLNYRSPYSYCYDRDSSNCAKYGRFYGRESVLEVCPAGWHLPNKNEWQKLIDVVGGNEIAGKALKSKNGWDEYNESSGNGTDDYGFSVLPIGFIDDDGFFEGMGQTAFFWTSSYSSYSDDYYVEHYFISFHNDSDRKMAFYYAKDDRGLSARCLKDTASVKSSSSSIPADELFTDERDGKTYRIVTIGEQTWMAENLNYETEESYCFKTAPAKCEKYGRLYSWYDAIKACPVGWHLPTRAEWDTLVYFAGGYSQAGLHLRSSTGWNHHNAFSKNFEVGHRNGDDSYGFTVLAAGFQNNAYFQDEGDAAYFWTSSWGTNRADNVEFQCDWDHVGKSSYPMYFALSVRCLKGEPPEPIDFVKSSSSESESSSSIVSPSSVVKGSFVDKRDGKKYKTVKIGDQTWMAENLNFAYLQPTDSLDSSSFCYLDSLRFCDRYGRLYLWSAAMDSAGLYSKNGKGCGARAECTPTEPVRGVCPEGWHLPQFSEWSTLIYAVGGATKAGVVLESTEGWDDTDVLAHGTNDYGFNVLPAGRFGCRNEKNYCSTGGSTGFWTSSISGYGPTTDARSIPFNNNDVSLLTHSGRSGGYSVRCVKDD
jgi:uncharacterized protein (TIGR02145 family)